MLIFKKEFLEQIVLHCKREFSKEACGILAGKEQRIEKVYEMTNMDKSLSAFFMEPREQFKVMKELKTLGLEMIGIYHSHLTIPAYPSSRDVELAFYPEISYVIVSFKDKNNPSIRSFKIKEGEIIEEEIKIF